jgi:hypothetical protein
MAITNADSSPNPSDGGEISGVWEMLRVRRDSVLELRALFGAGLITLKPVIYRHFRAKDFVTAGEVRRAFEITALKLSDEGYNVYTPMNPIRPDFSGIAATDSDILYRTQLLIDIDRRADKSQPASQRELDAAKAIAWDIVEFMALRGCPPPRVVMSGNGYHLYYPLDRLPNSAETSADIKSFLNALARKFDNKVVRVDTSVYNASRITRVPGTMNRKGVESPGRPYRRVVVCDGL